GETVPTATGETVLVAEFAGRVLFLSPLRHRPTGVHSIPNSPALAAHEALAGRQAFGRFRDYRGREVLAAVHPLAEANLGLVAKIDYGEALAEFRRDAAMEMAGAVLSLLALGGWFFGYRRYLWGTVASLREAEFRGLLES